MRWRGLVLGTIGVAILGILGFQFWDAHWKPDPKWLDTDHPDCQVWDAQPQRNETATWTGGCQAGKAEGAGTLTWRYTDRTDAPQTETYTGSLLAGNPNGHATTASSNGWRYDGDYRDGHRNGHGILTWSDGRYEGAFKDGKPDGFGTYTESGETHEGVWKQGCLDTKDDIVALGTDLDECRRILKSQ
jgi:hypothetical protein